MGPTTRITRTTLVALGLAIALAGCPQGGVNLFSEGWLYDAPGWQTGYRVFGLTDGNLVTIGSQRDDGVTSGVFYVRYSPGGTVLAERMLSGFPDQYVTRTLGRVLSNSDSVIAGLTTPSGEATEDRLRVVRLDPNGDTVWDSTFGDTEFTARAIVESPTGEILVAGNRTVSGSTYEGFVLLLTPGGDVVTSQVFEALDDGSDKVSFVDGEWIDDHYVLVGSYPAETSPGVYGRRYSVIRLNALAEVVTWQRTVGQYTNPVGIEALPDGFALLASSGSATRLITTDATGVFLSVSDNLFSQANPDERGSAVDFIVDSSGDIVFVGEGTTVDYAGGFFPLISRRAFIAKVTAAGEKVWQTSIDVPGTKVYGVTETADGGYATTGAADGDDDVLLNVILYDRDGHIVN